MAPESAAVQRVRQLLRRGRDACGCSTWRQLVRRAVVLAAVSTGLGVLIVVGLAIFRARFEAPEPTVLLRDRHGRYLGEIGGDDRTGRGYWPLDALPPRVVAATLAVEDRRFWDHPGVDPLAVGRALGQNLRTGHRVSGASTLAMQVARMQRPGPRTYARKAVEAVTALLLTARYGREAVLRHYLRIVPYGQQVHGIAHAARSYLDKPVADLSWAEVAFLTAIPQAPGRMNPFDPIGRHQAILRGQHILDLLLTDGALGRAEHALAREQLAHLEIPPRHGRPDEALHAVLGLEAVLGTGAADDDVRAAVAGSPVVRTTIDLDLQREVTWMLLHRLLAWESRGAGNGAVVVLDVTTHEVLAWVGSSDYFDARHAGAIDYARVPRSPGSTLKPFFYALALERGVIDAATVLDDLGRAAGDITNADGRFLGPLLPRMALANSRNVPAANLLATLGLDEGAAFLADLGLYDRRLPVSHYGLGLVLGGKPVTLEQLVTAYTLLSGDGRLEDLRWYNRQPHHPPRRLLSEATARQITLFLSDPMARLPSFPRMGWLEYPFPVAVKTGTSSGTHDAWTVAWSRRYLVGAWVGHPDFRPMTGLSGYHSAARLVRDVLLMLHADDADGLTDVGFPPPRGWHPVKLCALTGRRSTPATDRIVVEYFPPGAEPVESSQAHVRVAVDRRTGLLATTATPRAEVQVRTFVQLPPRYAEWQAANGLVPPPRETSPLGTDSPPAVLHPIAGLGPDRPRLARLDRDPGITITSPRPGLAIVRDPETPPGRATVALRATVDPPVEQVVWYVDGLPFTITDHPYTARWPLKPGDHTIQARIPFGTAASAPVHLTVR